MGSGITTTDGLEAGHRNLEWVEFGGSCPANAVLISGGYIPLVFVVSINVFYKWKVDHCKSLVIDKEALSSGSSQPTDLDISLIFTQGEG
jgi:hypothetical protein